LISKLNEPSKRGEIDSQIEDQFQILI